MRAPYYIEEHQDFIEVIDADGKSVVVADRSDLALMFLLKAIAAFNAA